MFGDQILAGQGADGRGRAGAAEGTAIGAGLAIDQRRQGAGGEGRGLGAFGGEAGEALGAQTLDLGRGEGGVAHHVGQQDQRGVEVGGDGGQAGRRAVHGGAHVDRGAEPLTRLGQGVGVAGGGALLHQGQHHGVDAEAVGVVSGVTGVELDGDAGDRDGGRPGVDDLDAVREGGALDVGEVEVGDVADGRHGVAGDAHDLGRGDRRSPGRDGGGLDIGLALAGLDDLAVDRAVQPALHGVADLGRGDGGIGGQLVAVEVGVAGVELALGQGRGLAVDLFQTLDGAGGVLGDDAVDLVLGRAVGEEVLEDGVHAGGDGGGVLTRLDVDRIAEEAEAVEGLGPGADAGGGLVAAHEGVVEARGGEAAEDGGADAERDGVRIEHAGHDPGAADAGLGDAVVQDFLDRGGEGRDVGSGRDIDRAARDGAEIAVHQGAGGRLVDVAGQDQHGVVGAVVVTEPVAHGLETGGVQIGHRADGRVAVGVADGEQRLLLGVGGQAIGLVVALALLVLDDAALQIEHLLADLAEQEAHAVALEEQGLLQRRGRDGLEIVGAVEPGGAVQAGGAGGAHGLDVALRGVLGAAEHQVFEQVGEAGGAGGLVLGADIVPDGHGHDGGLAVLVDDDGQAVVELEPRPGDVDAGDQVGDGRALQRRGLRQGGG